MKKHIRTIKKKIIPILKRYGVKKAAVFGSFVRGENKKRSDIDILVKIGKNISLLDFIGLKLEIERILGKKVDLVEYDTLKPFIKERALKEQKIILYEKRD
jgi:predicted nucleotidyltransferase